MLSINDRAQLAAVNALMQQRLQERLMLAGVTIEQPASTWVDSRVLVGADTVIRPNTVLDGACRIGRACVVGPMAHLRDAHVPDNSVLEHTHG